MISLLVCLQICQAIANVKYKIATVSKMILYFADDIYEPDFSHDITSLVQALLIGCIHV